MRYIQCLAKKLDHHVLNGGETKVCGHCVDWYDPASNTVYEFQGCYWHGATDVTQINTYSCLTMDQLLFIQTCNKIEKLKQAGYEVME